MRSLTLFTFCTLFLTLQGIAQSAEEMPMKIDKVEKVKTTQQDGEDSKTNANAPTIDFEEEVINYGNIEKGANGVREFKFTNNGKEPLIISNCKGSCGCTVPTCPKEPILPGQSGTIKVKYDTKRIGGFTKSVTVRSNASTPVKVLRIKGKVSTTAPNADPAKGNGTKEATPQKSGAGTVTPKK